MISILYNILFLIVPLIFFKNTSELFEFNKIVILYTFTVLIVSAWIIKSIKLNKIIFRRTILDWPLVIFISTLFVSSLFSIDLRTSIFGYYSRFNGGFLSILCYSLLYWAYVSNMNKLTTKKSIVYLLISTTIASFLAILEHFNFSTTCGLMNLGWTNYCWVQDVKNRVFSTLGQPNWLAAIIVSLIPVLFSFTLTTKNEKNKRSKLIPLYLSIFILFIALLFTKSRSGILGFLVADIFFSTLVIIKYKKDYLIKVVITNLIFGLLILVIGSPWSPSIFNVLNQNKNTSKEIENITNEPLLETGGTESGEIRKIVWKGAFKIWQEYPIVGTGPETFAFSYPMFKPLEHNQTSEWDFIYNKAHNEYLNYLATTGTLGFIAYITLIGFIIFSLFQNKSLFGFSLIAGFISILITNFFGFSVVTTSLIFFLFPAMSLNYKLESSENEKRIKFDKFNSSQKIYLFILLTISTFFIILIFRYWLADIYYNKARLLNRSDNPIKAREEIIKALKISKKEALYWNEYAISDSEIAILLSENNEYEKGAEFASYSYNESKQAVNLSKYNINLRKTQIGIYYKLFQFDKNYLLEAETVNKEAIIISPNDPKLYYQLGLLDIKLNKLEDAISYLEKSISLKPNYKEARFALGSIYKDIGNIEKANENFKYILEKIDPKDELTKKLYN